MGNKRRRNKALLYKSPLFYLFIYFLNTICLFFGAILGCLLRVASLVLSPEPVPVCFSSTNITIPLRTLVQMFFENSEPHWLATDMLWLLKSGLTTPTQTANMIITEEAET